MRRQALRVFVRDAGGHASVVRKFNLTQSQASYLSQLTAEGSAASFGERSARNWEERLRLPAGSLVRPGAPAGIDPDEFTFVTRADVSFSNGVGAVAYHQEDKPPLVFRKDFLRKLGISEGDAVVVDGAGHSNMPKIQDGAVVLVNKGDKTRLDGDFFAFRVADELLIKRLEIIKGVGVLATAENPDFKPKSVLYQGVEAEQPHLEVVGRAVWVGSTL